MLLVLRDKLSGVPAGPSRAKPFPHTNHPPLPPNPGDIPVWQFYLRETLSLSPADVAFLVPMRDCGNHDARADYELFTPDEKYFWHHQFTHIFTEQKLWLESIMKSTNPNVVTYNVSGPNARVNVGSHDQSTNVVVTDNAELFASLRDVLAKIPDEATRVNLAKAIDGMEEAAGKPTFTQQYQKFISLAADHVGLFSALLPALASLLGA